MLRLSDRAAKPASSPAKVDPDIHFGAADFVLYPGGPAVMGSFASCGGLESDLIVCDRPVMLVVPVASILHFFKTRREAAFVDDILRLPGARVGGVAFVS